MEIKIIKPGSSDNIFKPAIGVRSQDLLSRFQSFLAEDEMDTLKEETIHILSNCTDPKLKQEQETTHLSIGYVQSGKTMSFTLLTALAADNGYRVVIIIAGTKTNLLNQTTKRLRNDLINFSSLNNVYRIYENPKLLLVDEIRNKMRMSSKPLIILNVLKHYKHIDELTKILKSYSIQNELGKGGVLIIDDEADQASLNSFAYINSKKANTSDEWNEETDSRESSTYSSIVNLRSSIPNHSYVQYTATPQGPLLISILDLLSPKSHTVLTPGNKYKGGLTFFKDLPGLIIEIPDHEVFHHKYNPLTSAPKSLKESLQYYILSTTLIVNYWKKEKFLSMMIHSDRLNDVSKLFFKWIRELIDRWTTIFNLSNDDIAQIALFSEFEKIFNREVVKYYEEIDEVPNFMDISNLISDVINDAQTYLIIRESDTSKEIDWESSCSHILVGADMLNRGFTVENLAVTYMPRNSRSKSNADTIQQRCRFFGYKHNYLKSCRVYLPQESIKEFVDYVNHEEEMRCWLKECKKLEDVERQLIISDRLNPTRKNILPSNIVQSKMKGWHSLNALQYVDSNKLIVEEFLKKVHFSQFQPQYGTVDRNHLIAKVPIDKAIEFLTYFKFGNYSDLARKQATIRYLQYLSEEFVPKIDNVYFFQMAYESEYRERTFDLKSLKISQLFTGCSLGGVDVYPGDREIKKDDAICIQLHKVKLKHSGINKYVGKIIYTIAIYYPENFASSYVGVKQDCYDLEYEE